MRQLIKECLVTLALVVVLMPSNASALVDGDVFSDLLGARSRHVVVAKHTSSTTRASSFISVHRILVILKR